MMRFMFYSIVLLISCAPPGFGAMNAPIVIAHRGGMAQRPENTMDAFRNAAALGAEVLEFDMGVTADDRVVLHHNTSLDREICTPVPGADIAFPAPIRSLTLARIRQLDCGSRPPRAFPRQQPSPGARIPTLDELVQAFRGRNVILFGETKMEPDSSPYFVPPARFVSLIHAILKKYGAERRFLLQSSDYRTLDEMRKLDPAIGRCLVGARRFKPDYLALARKHQATHIMLHFNDLAAGDMDKLHAAGLKIYSSTADDPSSWRKYVELGMDGILTNDPSGLIRWLMNEGLRSGR
ncbi:MAG: Glycerophosphodiester phosphodiesterase [Bryobacteraceae bacterium]|nr:Glycerophosphodiester phosphodiesterase [Bryobacteraceae bacterium]